MFDSQTEADFYSALLNTGQPFKWQVKYVLQEPVRKDRHQELMRDSGVPEVHMVADFVVEWKGTIFIIDTKGSKKHATEKSRVIYKLLKGKLYADGNGANHAIIWLDADEVRLLGKLSIKPVEFFKYISTTKRI